MLQSRAMATNSPSRRRRCPLNTKIESLPLMQGKTPLVTTAKVAIALLIVVLASPAANAQQAWTWDQVKAKFITANPALKADALNVDEMKAEEVTAFLRPNPQLTFATDGTQL